MCRRLVPAIAIAFSLSFLLTVQAMARVAPLTKPPTPKGHLTIAVGYEKLTNSELEGDTYNPDQSNTTYFSIAYRHSLSRTLDWTIDLRYTVADGSFHKLGGTWDWYMDTMHLGPGLRYTLSGGWLRPYGQANLFLAGAGGDQPTTFSEAGGVGVGFAAGVDMRLSRTFSIPVEFVYSPIEFVSGYGVNSGLTWSW